MPDKPFVSIVTPVYNGAKYLNECIESVLAQTYDNWEFLIVDNASTDATPEIVASFAQRDARVRHIRFETFVGAIANHNRAIEAIDTSSVFCKVVQADDWLYPECLTRMVEAGQLSDSIAIVSSYRLWDREVDLVGLPYWKTQVDGRVILRQCLLGGPYVTGSPTALLLRSEYIRKRRPFYQDDFYFHDDTEAAYWLLSQYDFSMVHQVLSFARRQPGALMTSASRFNTYVPENLRCLLRYGPMVLDKHEYQTRLRHEIREYLGFQLRQLPKLSRLRDSEFFAVHENELERILDESDGDPEVRLAVFAIKALLARGRVGRKLRHIGKSRELAQ